MPCFQVIPLPPLFCHLSRQHLFLGRTLSHAAFCGTSRIPIVSTSCRGMPYPCVALMVQLRLLQHLQARAVGCSAAVSSNQFPTRDDALEGFNGRWHAVVIMFIRDICRPCVCSSTSDENGLKRASTELLQIALLDQTFDISLANVELTVFGQVDSTGDLCQQNDTRLS